VIYVVLGMHKSGTSLLARLLHESGIDMGEFDPRLGYADGNTFERHETQATNRALLEGLLLPPIAHLIRRGRRPALDAAGHPTNQDSQAYVRMRALERRLADEVRTKELLEPVIQDCSGRHESWGFKDPRNCLTYEAWKRHLPEHRVIAVYRGLGQVLSRSRAGMRHPFRALRVLWSWTLYNQHLLRALDEAQGPSLLLRYEQLMADETEIERLAQFVGRELHDARDARLHRTRGAVAIPAWVGPLRFLLPMDPHELEHRLEEHSATGRVAMSGSKEVSPS
jgi:hypothetical protein